MIRVVAVSLTDSAMSALGHIVVAANASRTSVQLNRTDLLTPTAERRLLSTGVDDDMVWDLGTAIHAGVEAPRPTQAGVPSPGIVDMPRQHKAARRQLSDRNSDVRIARFPAQVR